MHYKLSNKLAWELNTKDRRLIGFYMEIGDNSVYLSFICYAAMLKTIQRILCRFNKAFKMMEETGI